MEASEPLGAGGAGGVNVEENKTKRETSYKIEYTSVLARYAVLTFWVFTLLDQVQPTWWRWRI